MGGRRWTPDEEAFVILNRRRLTVAALARYLGRTERAVLSWCYRNNCWPWTGSWYTPIDVARLLGVSRQHICRLCTRRVIRARRVPGMRRWLIPPEEVERLVREQRPELWQRWQAGAPGARVGEQPRPLTEREVRRAA